MFEEVLRQKRERWGHVDDVAWGDETVAGVPMRVLSFTVTGPLGPIRNRLWTGPKGPYLVGFTCSGAVPTFDTSAARCSELIRSLRGR